jgi:NADH-quinone oxidoreductase subunit C
VSDPTPQRDAPEGVVDETSPEPQQRYGASVTFSRGQLVLHTDRSELQGLVRRLCDEEGFNVCLDVTAVDYLTYDAPRDVPEGVTPERFEVVVTLVSLGSGERLRIRVQVPADDPVVPSLFEIHPGTEAFEREVYDMFGIRFDGHPDLTRILMPEDWEGHPLRKDYAIGRIPVQFKGVVNER